MLKRSIIISITIFLIILFAADINAAEEIKLVVDDSGRTIQAYPNQVIAIGLDANPTTGYLWDITEKPDGKVLRYLNTTYIIRNKELIGSGRSEVWRFIAVGKGITSFKLAYFRPFEKGKEPIYTFTLKVEVR